MWKQSKSAFVDTPNIADYGWEDDGSVCWAKDIYPEDNEEEDEVYEYESDIDSEDEEQ